MAGPFSWLAFLTLFGGVAYVHWLSQQERPTDLTAIDIFAEQHALRIISVTRDSSYKTFSYLFRGVSVSGLARFYDVTVDNSQGQRGDIHLAFDSMFGSERLKMLDPQGLMLARSATQSVSETAQPSPWYEWLILFCAGAGLSGFIFSGILHSHLSPPNRPAFPDPALGYTHHFKAKYGNVYGTYFEYLAVTYGVWAMWGLAIVSGLFGRILHIQYMPRIQNKLILAAAVISMVLYYAIWQVSGTQS